MKILIADDHAFCGRSPYPGSSSSGCHSLIAGDGHDDHAKGKGLHHSADDIKIRDMNGEGIEKRIRGKMIKAYGNGVPPQYAHNGAKYG